MLKRVKNVEEVKNKKVNDGGENLAFILAIVRRIHFLNLQIMKLFENGPLLFWNIHKLIETSTNADLMQML